MDGKNSFLLYRDLEPTIAKLADDEAGKLFKHLLAYVNDKDPILEDRLLELVFEPIKQSLKRDLKKREGIRKKRAEAGKLGGKAKVANASKGKQKLANVAVSDSVSVSDSVINNTAPTVHKFSPPSVEQVKEYCDERKNTIDPQTFLDHYETNGRVQGRGNKKVKDWKACVRTWENNQRAEQKAKEPQTMDEWVKLYEKMGHVPFRIKYGTEKATEIKLYII